MKRIFLLSLLLSCTRLTLTQTSIWNTQTIHWQEINPDGTKYAVLEGDRAKPGTFSYAFFMPDGTWYPAHFHSEAARVFVARGTLLLGEGSSMDKRKAVGIPAGGFFLVPKRSPHWEGAKGDTLILGVASGPWITTVLPAARR